MSIADTELTRKALDQLDLIVTIDINYSDIAWYSDVILPESTYLERTDCVQQANGLKPQMFLRKQTVPPRRACEHAATWSRLLWIEPFFQCA